MPSGTVWRNVIGGGNLGENYDSATVKIRPDHCGLQFHQRGVQAAFYFSAEFVRDDSGAGDGAWI